MQDLIKKKLYVVSLLLLALLFVFSLLGCNKQSNEGFYSDVGIFGKHDLIRMESFAIVEGSVFGGFFLGCGSVNGNIGSEYKLQFWWEREHDKYVATSFPYSMFEFEIDPNSTNPTVEFIFNDEWLSSVHIRTKLAEDNKLNFNVNTLLKKYSYYVKLVKITLSKEVLENEVYLPKIN